MSACCPRLRRWIGILRRTTLLGAPPSAPSHRSAGRSWTEVSHPRNCADASRPVRCTFRRWLDSPGYVAHGWYDGNINYQKTSARSIWPFFSPILSSRCRASARESRNLCRRVCHIPGICRHLLPLRRRTRTLAETSGVTLPSFFPSSFWSSCPLPPFSPRQVLALTERWNYIRLHKDVNKWFFWVNFWF